MSIRSHCIRTYNEYTVALYSYLQWVYGRIVFVLTMSIRSHCIRTYNEYTVALYSYLLVFYLVIEMSREPIIEDAGANVKGWPGLQLNPLPGVGVVVDWVRQVVTLRNRRKPERLDESVNADVTLRHVTTRYVTLRHATTRYDTLRHVTTRYVTLRHVTSRYDTLRRCKLEDGEHGEGQTLSDNKIAAI